MKLIGATACDDLHLGAAIAAEFGRVCGCLDLKLGHSFGNHTSTVDCDAEVVVVRSVDDEVVVSSPLSVCRKLVRSGCATDSRRKHGKPCDVTIRRSRWDAFDDASVQCTRYRGVAFADVRDRGCDS